MTAPTPLSEEDLADARKALSEGKPITVWFTSAAVGVPVNGSAKVVAIDDVAEGDFIQVKPAGTQDTMFCSPNELTRVRPPRKRPQRSEGKQPEQPKQLDRPERSAPAEARSVREPASAPVTPEAKKSVAKPAAKKAESTGRKSERTSDRSRASGRSTARATDITVTLTANPDGEWTVEVMTGKKRTVRPTPVQPADVAKAARSLPPAVTEAIETSLDAARQRQLERVERLRAELDAAQQALQELSG